MQSILFWCSGKANMTGSHVPSLTLNAQVRVSSCVSFSECTHVFQKHPYFLKIAQTKRRRGSTPKLLPAEDARYLYCPRMQYRLSKSASLVKANKSCLKFSKRVFSKMARLGSYWRKNQTYVHVRAWILRVFSVNTDQLLPKQSTLEKISSE